MTDPDAHSRAEDLQIREALGYLTSITKWLAANAAQASGAVAAAEELGRAEAVAGYQARNLRIATLASGPDRLRFDRSGTRAALAILEGAMTQSDRTAGYLAARDALLLGFYVSEKTYGVLAEHYRAFVATTAAHLSAHPGLVTGACRKYVRAIAEDLHDSGLGNEAARLTAALG